MRPGAITFRIASHRKGLATDRNSDTLFRGREKKRKQANNKRKRRIDP